eukprot:PhF_6_TR36158/c0_g1_i2/m.52594
MTDPPSNPSLRRVNSNESNFSFSSSGRRGFYGALTFAPASGGGNTNEKDITKSVAITPPPSYASKEHHNNNNKKSESPSSPGTPTPPLFHRLVTATPPPPRSLSEPRQRMSAGSIVPLNTTMDGVRERLRVLTIRLTQLKREQCVERYANETLDLQRQYDHLDAIWKDHLWTGGSGVDSACTSPRSGTPIPSFNLSSSVQQQQQPSSLNNSTNRNSGDSNIVFFLEWLDNQRKAGGTSGGDLEDHPIQQFIKDTSNHGHSQSYVAYAKAVLAAYSALCLLLRIIFIAFVFTLHVSWKPSWAGYNMISNNPRVMQEWLGNTWGALVFALLAATVFLTGVPVLVLGYGCNSPRWYVRFLASEGAPLLC